jgi:hypothetical protein
LRGFVSVEISGFHGLADATGVSRYEPENSLAATTPAQR